VPHADYALWRGLVSEQVKRAAAEGVAPQEALFLAGPDSGAPYVPAADWGGELHIPYEGACDADVFVLPDWHGWDRISAAYAKSAIAGVPNHKCRKVLISARDLGQFEAEERVTCDGWFVYTQRHEL
jgi:hypothetical protein